MKGRQALYRFVGLSVLIGWNCIWTTVVQAQCPNTIPNVSEYGTGSYSVKQVGSTCLPYTVNVANTLPGSTHVRTLFDYRGGPISADSLKTDTLHTYTRPGKYTIVQFSEKDGRQLIACPDVYVYDTLPPAVRMVPCGDARVKLIFESLPRYDSHWIAWGDGNVQEISTYAKSANHTYDTPPPHTITVWGTVNPGLCRSRDQLLVFDPAQNLPPPSIKSFTPPDASTTELVIDNPSKSELVLLKKREMGIWESTGRIVTQIQETLQVPMDSLSLLCFRLQPTDTCLVVSQQSDAVCSATLQITSSDQAHTLSWRTLEVPPQAKVTILKDAVYWQDISALGAMGDLIDPDLSCGRDHCYQLTIASPGYLFSSQVLCRRSPAALCGPTLSLFVPDAFSPNGDGMNDFFEIKGDAFTFFELSIFSPWGTVLFHSTEQHSSWDGKFQDHWVAPGTYLYSLTVESSGLGQRHTRRGSVLVLK
ncbi:gliding motility-associated C-terminal domain-containing protein [Salmonirosea aquatica]|uniref:T9SS type B sorting domain-containing protein n=1 Tax=Salmonirosea aquatica TaxID=2654236 RepID=A0A7C9BN67_9BACT|nr:T9SS type B sorting domain-containing protein [Cytophagaceae bacterium SJW1-29]